MRKYLVVLVTACAVATAGMTDVRAESGGPEGGDFEVIHNAYDIVPIRQAYLYGRYGTDGSLSPNPSPGVIHQADEFFSIPYVDESGTVYDAQANLTRGTLRIMQSGNVVALATLSSADLEVMKLAAKEADEPTTQAATAIVVAILAGVVVLGLQIAYDEMVSERECQRGYITRVRVLSTEMRRCLATTGSYDYQPPSQYSCGADGQVMC